MDFPFTVTFVQSDNVTARDVSANTYTTWIQDPSTGTILLSFPAYSMTNAVAGIISTVVVGTNVVASLAGGVLVAKEVTATTPLGTHIFHGVAAVTL